MSYQIDKVKISKTKVSIEYSKQKKGGMDSFVMHCSDVPLPQ